MICDDGEVTMEDEGGSTKSGGWFDDAMTRRAVFGLLGLTAMSTACSSSGYAAGSTTTSTVPNNRCDLVADHRAAVEPTASVAVTVPQRQQRQQRRSPHRQRHRHRHRHLSSLGTLRASSPAST